MRGTKRAISIGLIGVLIALPLSNGFAQPSEIEEAMQQARMDAQRDVNETLWLAIGCLGSIGGLAASYLYAPSPPAAALLGKSPVYVAHYTDTYKREAQSIQSRNALRGCFIAAAAYAAYWLVVVLLVGAGS